MSKTSTIALTPAGQNPAGAVFSFLDPALTPEQKDKLQKSVSRVVSRHGWTAFAEALAAACEVGVDTSRSSPKVAALWRHRAETARGLAHYDLSTLLEPT